jgi:hypothetical protein
MVAGGAVKVRGGHINDQGIRSGAQIFGVMDGSRMLLALDIDLKGSVGDRFGDVVPGVAARSEADLLEDLPGGSELRLRVH